MPARLKWMDECTRIEYKTLDCWMLDKWVDNRLMEDY